MNLQRKLSVTSTHAEVRIAKKIKPCCQSLSLAHYFSSSRLNSKIKTGPVIWDMSTIVAQKECLYTETALIYSVTKIRVQPVVENLS